MAKKPRTLTAKSTALLRELDYKAYYVEGFQHPAVCIKVAQQNPRSTSPFVPLKKDFLGIADIVAFGKGETLYVQVTDQSNVPKHKAAYMEGKKGEALIDCLTGGNHFVIHAWPRDPDSDAECFIHEAILRSGKVNWLMSSEEK